MTWIYNLAFIFFGIFYLPTFLFKIKRAESRKQLLKERFGFLSRELQKKLLGKKVIWIHAVSVGEVIAVQNFIRGFLPPHPEHHVVLTTVTPTGQKIAKELESSQVSVCYAPFDITIAVRRFFKTLDPECLLLMETEIWPNLLVEAGRFRVPVGMLNARLSLRSAKSYGRFRYFFKEVFSAIHFVLAQDGQDAKRFACLGIPATSIQVLGNMKFDNQPLADLDATDAVRMKTQWGFSSKDQIVIAGSTHEGEEKILAEVFLDLKNNFPNLKMLIAPRHVERSEKIAALFQSRKFAVALASRLQETSSFDVLILDQLGVLKKLYAMADIVYVGGSLVRRGGQNPIEPANFKRPIVHGPFVRNFEGVYRTLDQQGGAILIRDQAELVFAFSHLLQDEGERKKLGANAFEIVHQMRGATLRHIEWISDFLNGKKERERKNHALLSENVFSPSR